MKPINRAGFTMVELLVCCLCLASVAAVGLPALQQQRDEEKLRLCANRMRQIALASHNYHDAYRRLPNSTLGFPAQDVTAKNWIDETSEQYWKRAQNTSALTLIMPFMELNRIAGRLDRNATNFRVTLNDLRSEPENQLLYEWQAELPGTQTAAKIHVPDFLCPSDTISVAKIEKLIIATQPLINSDEVDNDLGLQYWPEEDEIKNFKRTNFLANGGICGGQTDEENADRFSFQGPMRCRTETTLANVEDGTSNTIMFGESIGEIIDGKRTAAQSTIWGGHARARGDIPFQKQHFDGNEARRLLGDKTWSSAIGFGSKHKDGVVFAFADGSVGSIGRDIDMETYYGLIGMADGNDVTGFRDRK